MYQSKDSMGLDQRLFVGRKGEVRQIKAARKRVGGIVSKGVEQLKSPQMAWIVKNKNYFWSTNN
jgi:hypothetical protein